MKFDEDWFLVGAQYCIETGLMSMLGIQPTDIFAGDWPSSEDVNPGMFVAPGEVA